MKKTILFVFMLSLLSPSAFAQNWMRSLVKKMSRSASAQEQTAAKQAGKAAEKLSVRAAAAGQSSAQAARQTAAKPAAVWTTADRMRAFHKLRNGFPPREYGSTFYRFAMDVEDWFVSGENVVLHGRKEIAKYMAAARGGVKEIPVKDGKVQLDIAADLSREGVDYQVITRPSQFPKRAAQKASNTDGAAWDKKNTEDLLSGDPVDFNEFDYLKDNL